MEEIGLGHGIAFESLVYLNDEWLNHIAINSWLCLLKWFEGRAKTMITIGEPNVIFFKLNQP